MQSKFDEMAADINKFHDVLQRVKACSPTGVTEDEIFSMAIAVHLWKRDTMSYKARDYSENRWRNQLSYKGLHMHLKFADEEFFTSALDKATMFGVGASIVDIEKKISNMPSTPHERVGMQETLHDGFHKSNTVCDAVHTSSTVCNEVGGESNSSAVEVPDV